MTTKPKVLFYNWEPAFATPRRGGGVSVYQDNCISLFLNRGWEVHSLSAGTAYDLTSSVPYVTRIIESQRAGVGFALINSPVVAPTIYSFFTNQVTSGESSDQAVAEAIIDLVRKNGPYDVFHFNNLEGLPAAVLPILRREFRDSRFIFFVHNYYPMCPQVNLWKNDSMNCDGKEGGKACFSCLGNEALADSRASSVASEGAISDAIFGSRTQPRRTFVRKGIRKLVRLGKGREVLNLLRRQIGNPLPFEGEEQLNGNDLVSYFRDREENMVRIINESFDVVLCDSERVRVLSVNAGMSPEICKTCYPGTAFYRTPLPIHKPSNETPLKLAFIGVANIKFKGLEFLLSALEKCDDALLSKLHVLIAAKWIYQNPENRTRLSALRARLSGLTVQDGYSHKELGELLADVDLGVVPHLWEDCYPQVTVEFVCNGVPVIISNLGGAKEVSSQPDFEFDVGNHARIVELIEKFANDKQKLLNFWSKEPVIRSMDAHFEELFDHYRAPVSVEV